MARTASLLERSSNPFNLRANAEEVFKRSRIPLRSEMCRTKARGPGPGASKKKQKQQKTQKQRRNRNKKKQKQPRSIQEIARECTTTQHLPLEERLQFGNNVSKSSNVITGRTTIFPLISGYVQISKGAGDAKKRIRGTLPGGISPHSRDDASLAGRRENTMTKSSFKASRCLWVRTTTLHTVASGNLDLEVSRFQNKQIGSLQALDACPGASLDDQLRWPVFQMYCRDYTYITA